MQVKVQYHRDICSQYHRGICSQYHMALFPQGFGVKDSVNPNPTHPKSLPLTLTLTLTMILGTNIPSDTVTCDLHFVSAARYPCLIYQAIPSSHLGWGGYNESHRNKIF